MKWFKPRYTVCAKCQVHFEPYSSEAVSLILGGPPGTISAVHGDRFDNYCPTHRREKINELEEKEYLLFWARNNKQLIDFVMLDVDRMRWVVDSWPKLSKDYIDHKWERIVPKTPNHKK